MLLNPIETDYLIVGAGAAALAFADTLLDQSDAHITIVDRHGKPGGHPRAALVNMWNQFQWGQDKVLRSWIRHSRLDGFGKLMSGIDPQDTEKLAIVARLREQAAAAMANLPKLITSNPNTGDRP